MLSAADLFARISPYLAHRPGSARATQAHAWLVRRTGGRVGGRALGGDFLVLRTVGRRSGRERDAPLFFVAHGEGFAVVASNAASERPPAWWLNLQADPDAEAVVRGHTYPVRARAATEEEVQRALAAARAALPRLRALPVDRHTDTARGDTRPIRDRPALSVTRGGSAVFGDRAGARLAVLDRAEARLRRGRRLAPPPPCWRTSRRPPAQLLAVRVSPRGLVVGRCVLFLADLPVDWIVVVLEQDARAHQPERFPGALRECRCPSRTEHVFVR